MSKDIKIKIDGVEIIAKEGQYIVEAAADKGIFIPTLCNAIGIKPKGSCRICSVMINGRPMAACTTPVSEGMEIQNDVAEINEMRKEIIELLLVEGNHFCPGCERSGTCELQALAYKYLVMVPRFDYMFPNRQLDADHPLIMKDNNRCILCKRCIRGIKDENGDSFFAFTRRGHKVAIELDPQLSEKLTPELAKKAADICPVGAIIYKGKGFDEAIGTRKYDKCAIGSDIENKGGCAK